MISVLLITFNEQENIGSCLAHLSWCDDIWVVDSHSDDATVAIAEAMGAKVISRPWTNFADQRNFGIAAAEFRHDWILHLDADEVVSPELRQELLQVARQAPSDIGAYELPFRVRFMGRWLRHGGAYPQPQVRFGHRDRLRFRMVGHGQKELLQDGRLGVLRGDVLHFSFGKGIRAWVEKHNVYADRDATEELSPTGPAALAASFEARVRRFLRRASRHMPARPALRFIYAYLLKLGFLDGRAGFYYAWLYGFYEGLIVLRRRELVGGVDSLAVWHAGPAASRSAK